MSEEVECTVLQSLIKRLKDNKKIQVAEKMIKDSGLVWRVPFQMSDTVKIIGPNHDVLEFAIECLETIMDQDRNPACFLQNGKVKFYFLDTLGEKIFDSRKELWERHLSVEIDKVPNKCVKLECSFEDYSKIKQIIDKIRHSIPSSGSRSGSLDKSQQNGYLGSSNTPLLANKHSAILYSFNANKIKVIVYKASIIEVDGIDAIVNAANEDLSHCGGIALAISIAAGSSVDNECSNHVSLKGRVEVSNCFVTGPGNLKHLKGIIHAVGPRWDAYTDKKKCAMDLNETVVHVLQTAHERRF
ncbi:hypothetical protein CHS0354_016659 [Potamilus streckersoni]|uniref:Macro domain-containing protein n=1 Tax=Potamilus streckersoni TaxID=2493646 RepID=A0AAE0WEJ0_9BIVA|nr:hypothetical protein CHS0354_016659 [Potamilus streckersoni]